MQEQKVTVFLLDGIFVVTMYLLVIYKDNLVHTSGRIIPWLFFSSIVHFLEGAVLRTKREKKGDRFCIDPLLIWGW